MCKENCPQNKMRVSMQNRHLCRSPSVVLSVNGLLLPSRLEAEQKEQIHVRSCPGERMESQTGRKWDSRRAATHNRSPHQDEFSTVHTLRGARQLARCPRGHVQKTKCLSHQSPTVWPWSESKESLVFTYVKHFKQIWGKSAAHHLLLSLKNAVCRLWSSACGCSHSKSAAVGCSFLNNNKKKTQPISSCSGVAHISLPQRAQKRGKRTKTEERERERWKGRWRKAVLGQI